MEYSDQVVAVISECVVKVVRQLLSEYNMQVNNKLKNVVITADNIKPLSIQGENIASGAVGGTQIGVGAITGSNIAPGAITGDNIAAGTITSINIQDASIDTAKINNLTAEVMNAVVANIATADINWAEIESLEAYTAEIANATIKNASIDMAQIKDLEATVADMTLANIGSAKIDFGQIYDLAANTAIITQGVAGELYVTNLVVTEANMASLTTGRLVLRDDDGNLHEFKVDDDGNVTTVPVQVETNNIASGAVTGENIANGTITAGNVNAVAMFGDEAVMVQLTANMGKFANLFAVDAVVEQLKVHLLETDYLKVLIHDTIGAGGRNLVRASDTKYNNTNFVLATYEFGKEPPVAGERITIRLKGVLGTGKTKFRITNSGEDVVIGDLMPNGDGTFGASVQWQTTYIDSSGTVHEVSNTYIDVCVMEETTTGVTSSVDWIMVERGNHPSDWSPAPEDTADAVDGVVKQISQVRLDLTPESLASTVMSTQQYMDDRESIRSSAVTQTKGELDVRFTSIEQTATDAANAANSLKSQLDTWYSFGIDALEIGKSNSLSKTRQDNEKYEFLYNEAVVASISGSQMMIPRARITDELRIGGMKILVDKSTGAMEWVWVGLD